MIKNCTKIKIGIYKININQINAKIYLILINLSIKIMLPLTRLNRTLYIKKKKKMI